MNGKKSHKLRTPVSCEIVNSIASGDRVSISGVIYTARDAAHRRFMESIESKEPLPVDLRGQILYYTGPTPPRPGCAAGSAGPTTSSRMDRYTPRLIAETGLRGIIGKGDRNADVVEALKKNGCVYFAATGGAGALLGRCVKRSRVVCYGDLGPEAVYELEVADFPLIAAIDARGNDAYLEGPGLWAGKWTR